MLAGCVPGGVAVLYDYVRMGQLGPITMPFLVFYYFITPAVLAGISGFLFGADILNPAKVQSRRQAAKRGLIVSLLAWLVFTPILSSVMGQAMNVSFLNKLLMILTFGSLVIGWVIAGVGVATGVLLYDLRKPHQTV